MIRRFFNVLFPAWAENAKKTRAMFPWTENAKKTRAMFPWMENAKSLVQSIFFRLYHGQNNFQMKNSWIKIENQHKNMENHRIALQYCITELHYSIALQYCIS